jgi:squalene synthase HpnC
MKSASEFRSGKGEGDENFPVASHLIAPRYRAPILAFYRFVRTADDIADHPTLTPAEKIDLIDRLGAALTGEGPPDEAAEPLRLAIAERGLTARHALDILDAFRLDAQIARYADWPDLIAYCALSAMPVGRFVLDVHGEDHATWAASDALCAALQVINHLQDCGDDYRDLDRVYLPLDIMAAHGAAIEDLGSERASPALLAVIRDSAERTAGLLRESAVFPSLIGDRRLSLEVSVIQTLAEALTRKLHHRDPLSQRVHASKPEALALAGLGVLRGLRARRRASAAAPARVTP